MKTTRPKEKWGAVMSGTIRARVRHGVLEPLEKLELPEGMEVTVTIVETPSAEDLEMLGRVAGAWKGKVDAETLIRDIYANRLLATRPEPRLSP